MIIEIALYLLIGFTGLLCIKASSINEVLKEVVMVIFWPYFILLKYVEMVDRVKKGES